MYLFKLFLMFFYRQCEPMTLERERRRSMLWVQQIYQGSWCLHGNTGENTLLLYFKAGCGRFYRLTPTATSDFYWKANGVRKPEHIGAKQSKKHIVDSIFQSLGVGKDSWNGLLPILACVTSPTVLLVWVEGNVRDRIISLCTVGDGTGCIVVQHACTQMI